MTRSQRIYLFRIILSAVLTVIISFIPVDGALRLVMYLVPYLISGYDIILSSFINIAHGQFFDEQFLMTVATVGAFAIGEYTEGAMVMVFYQTGELFQSIAVGKSRRSIASLMEICPESASVVREGREVTLSPEEVEVGESIVIRPGERIPLDGTVIGGSTSVDTAALTGESLPRECTVGDRVISGSINISGVITVRTESRYEDSTVSNILALVETSAERKARAERFITRFARVYTPIVVCTALLLALLPPIFFGQPWEEWIRRALIFLMVSCPCALVISVPMSFFGGIGGASKKGILIKGADRLEALAHITAAVFDKTGTLTQGHFSVSGIYPSALSSREELLTTAARGEAYSNHPIALSLREAYKEYSKCTEADAEGIGEAREIAGRGIEIYVDNELCLIGNALLMTENGITPSDNDSDSGETVTHVARDGRYLGYITASDKIKPHSPEAVAELKRLGVKRTVMLTGDGERAAERVSKETGIDEYRFGLLPKDKVDILESIMKSGGKTLFVGDGINDAPVLMRSDIGIAMGALGSDAAIEAADAVIMDDNILKIADAVRISRRTMRIVKQNIVFALSVKILILILGAVGLVGIWAAVFADVGVMVIAILNALRAMK